MVLEDRIIRVLIVGLFFIGLFLPLADSVFDLDGTVFDENRTLAAKPAWMWSVKSINEYPKTFENWYNDHFGFRRKLIRDLSLIGVKWLGVSLHQNVVLGKEGWLYWTSPNPVQVFQGMPPFSEAELEALRIYYEVRRDRLAAKGIPYIVVVAPDKHEIYPEFVPRTYARTGPEGTRVDQFYRYMKEHSSLALVDVRPALLELKNKRTADYFLFYKTDTHWTQIGGMVAVNEVMKTVQQLLPNTVFDPTLKDFTVTLVEQNHGHDISRMIGLYAELPEPEVVVVPKAGFRSRLIDDPNVVPPQNTQPGRQAIVMEQPNSRLPSAVVFRDSFATAMIPFLSEYFGRVVYYWEHGVNHEVIDHERPAIVIEELSERILSLPLLRQRDYSSQKPMQ